MIRMITLAAAAILGMFSTSAIAGPVLGSFNLGGTLTFTNNSIAFPNNTISGPTGIYSSVANPTLNTLNFPPDPIGLTFPPHAFLSFGINPTFVADLDITSIFSGNFGSAQCATPPPLDKRARPAAHPSIS